MTIDTKSDFKDLATIGVPVKRAAYSDRTAWIMAILAELAYIPGSSHKCMHDSGMISPITRRPKDEE